MNAPHPISTLATRCRQAVANTPEPPAVEPTFTLDRHIANARREMGEARWAQLNSEWEL